MMTAQPQRISHTSGLLAAGYSPFHPDGRLNTEPVEAMVDFLVEQGTQGIYICGSTGEGPSLTTEERKIICEAYVAASAGRIPIWVQVGHTSVHEARALAEHAVEAGADYLSACSPFYFPLSTEEQLLDCLREMTRTVQGTPFYYYHIPAMTGVSLDMLRFLALAEQDMPNLAGIKFSAPLIHEFRQCQDYGGGRYDILWGADEMLLGAFASGARGAIGSTYNVGMPLYKRVIEAFQAGDLEAAQEWQAQAVDMINVLFRDGKFHAANKAVLTAKGIPLGGVRLPLRNLTGQEEKALLTDLERKPYGALLFASSSSAVAS